jgi:hypothetical protein
MSDFSDDILGTLALGGLFWLFGKHVQSETLKDVESAVQNIELERLRAEVEALKRNNGLIT